MKYNYHVQYHGLDIFDCGHGVIVYYVCEKRSIFIGYIEGYEWERGAKEVNIYINKAHWYEDRIEGIHGEDIIGRAKEFILQFIKGEYDPDNDENSLKYRFQIGFNA